MMPFAVERSRWLAELAQAIEEAQQLVWEIGTAVGGSSAMLDLSARLEVVRDELDSIRRGRGTAREAPNWTQLPRSEMFEPGAR